MLTRRLLLPLALLASTTAAPAGTLGVHLVSAHFGAPVAAYMNNTNPGLYWRGEGGLTAGAYRNSLGRMSLYLGHTLGTGPLQLTLGVVSGYQRKRIDGAEFCPGVGWTNCHTHAGNRAALAPLVAPSLRLPLPGADTAGAARITWLPSKAGHAHAIHLSLEFDQ